MITAYVIERGIPLPPTQRGPGGTYKGPKLAFNKAVAALEVGESVLTPSPTEAKAAGQLFLRMRPQEYAIRKIGGEGWRVWRVV